MITKPTRVTDSTASLLDNIFVRDPINFISGIIENTITDHYPVFYIKKDLFPNNNKNSSITVRFRIINENTIAKFESSLLSCDFGDVLRGGCIDSSIRYLMDKLYLCYDSSCPIKAKTLSPKCLNCPWITVEIKEQIKMREAYSKLCREGKISKLLFNRYRNYVTNVIRKSKAEYYRNKFNCTKNNIKHTWRIINSILKSSKGNKKSIPKLFYKGDYYDDDEDIANIINEFFVKVGSEIGNMSSAPPVDHRQYMRGDYAQSFFRR